MFFYAAFFSPEAEEYGGFPPESNYLFLGWAMVCFLPTWGLVFLALILPRKMRPVLVRPHGLACHQGNAPLKKWLLSLGVALVASCGRLQAEPPQNFVASLSVPPVILQKGVSCLSDLTLVHPVPSKGVKQDVFEIAL